MTYRFICF